MIACFSREWVGPCLIRLAGGGDCRPKRHQSRGHVRSPARPQDRKIPWGIWKCILRQGAACRIAKLQGWMHLPQDRKTARSPGDSRNASCGGGNLQLSPACKVGGTSRKTARPQDPLEILEMHFAGGENLEGGASILPGGAFGSKLIAGGASDFTGE